MRVVLHSVLREGQESAYELAHAKIRPDLMASLQSAGIHDWAIWRSGRDLFHLVDCEDFDAAMKTLAGDPVNACWQTEMAQYVDHFVNAAGDSELGISQWVWTLTTQLEGER